MSLTTDYRELSTYTIRLAVTLFPVFLLDKELEGTWDAIVQNKEVKGSSSDPDWYLAKLR